MVDLTTSWLGLELDCPLVAGAGPLADDLDSARRLEQVGAAAIVMQSLFEEQLQSDQLAMFHHTESVADSHPEASSYFVETQGDALDTGLGPDAYLRHLERLKRTVSIPVIASLNGISPGGWVRYGRRMADAGADALELNVYYVASDPDEAPADVEQRYVDLVTELDAAIGIPIAVKLSPYFSSLGHLARRLREAGADGLVLFNRFYQPDIDPELLEVVPSLHLSTPDELRLRLRWLATLYGRVDLDLACTGGVHDSVGAVKALMAGASAVQMTSALLRNGAAHLGTVRRGLEVWLEEHDYTSVRQMIGSMSLARCPDPAAMERANYRRVLGVWHRF